MSKHNRNNNPNFRPTDHQYPQDNRRVRDKAANAANSQTSNPSRSEAERDRDRELLRAIFGKEITANRILDTLEDIAAQGKQTVKALDEMQKSFIDYRENLTSIAALMTCAVLAIGNEEEQKALREFLDSDDEDVAEATVDNHGGETTKADTNADDAPPAVKYALRTDIDMNELMRAAIAATEEDPATVRKVTEAIAAYLMAQMKTSSHLAKRIMTELDAVTMKRVEGSTDPADFDAVVNVIKVALPTIVTAVADATEIERTIVDRIAFAELIAAKKMLVNTARVTTDEEAERMVQGLTVAETKGKTRDANGVEVE